MDQDGDYRNPRPRALPGRLRQWTGHAGCAQGEVRYFGDTVTLNFEMTSFRSLQTVTNLLIVSLAVSDLLVGD